MKYLVAALTLGTILMTINWLNRDNNGIIPIGEEAVFIRGEACVVNITPERTEEEIGSDMIRCLELNRGWE